MTAGRGTLERCPSPAPMPRTLDEPLTYVGGAWEHDGAIRFSLFNLPE
jgi:hypothetical protein